MNIDPKQIARMISEDPDEVAPGDHFDDTEDEYDASVKGWELEEFTYYIVKVPTEHSDKWEDSQRRIDAVEYHQRGCGPNGDEDPTWKIDQLLDTVRRLREPDNMSRFVKKSRDEVEAERLRKTNEDEY